MSDYHLTKSGQFTYLTNYNVIAKRLLVKMTFLPEIKTLQAIYIIIWNSQKDITISLILFAITGIATKKDNLGHMKERHFHALMDTPQVLSC